MNSRHVLIYLYVRYNKLTFNRSVDRAHTDHKTNAIVLMTHREGLVTERFILSPTVKTATYRFSHILALSIRESLIRLETVWYV